MSKVIRWEGGFADIRNTQYTVRIYGEDNGGSTEEITFGSEALTTVEEDDDDPSCSIRMQTGTLNVYVPDGSTLEEDLIPSDDIDHPVVVLNGSTIAWQGFLSCETYTQQLTDRGRIVSFNLKGMMAAMDCVTADAPTATTMSAASLVSLYAGYLPEDLQYNQQWHVDNDGTLQSYGDKVYVQTASVIERVERRLDTGVIEVRYRMKKFSDVIGQLCLLIGLTAREYGNTMYFINTDDAREQVQMQNLEYRGTNHQTTHIAPARDVVVEAKLEDEDTGISIPDTPTLPSLAVIDESGYMCTSANKFYEQQKLDTWSHIHLKQAVATAYNSITEVSTPVALSTKMGYNQNSDSRARFTNKSGQAYCGAAFLKNWKNDSVRGYDTASNQGLYATFFTDSGLDDDTALPSTTPYIIRMEGLIPMKMKDGMISLKMQMQVAGFEKAAGIWYSKKDKWQQLFYIYYSLKVGNKYYQGGGWSTTKAISRMMVTSSDVEVLISIPSSGLSGSVELCIYPVLAVNGWKTEDDEGKRDMPCEIFFTGISLEHRNINWKLFNDEQNDYIASTGAAAREDITISTGYATDRGNVPCTNTLLTASGSQLTSLGGSRPETRLVNRMSTYYSTVRRRTTLEVEIGANPFFRKRITQSGKTYFVASEERDWMTATSKITLLEIP